jgi:hypothetical protein
MHGLPAGLTAQLFAPEIGESGASQQNQNQCDDHWTIQPSVCIVSLERVSDLHLGSRLSSPWTDEQVQR